MKERFVWVDLMRIIAAFGIVACHLMLIPATEGVARLVRFCDINVGIFSAIAGYVMVIRSKDATISQYIRKRTGRIFPLYLFWTTIYLLSSLLFKVITKDSLAQYSDLSFWYSVVFQGGAACHLWFLIALFYGQCIVSVLPIRMKSEVGTLSLSIALLCLSCYSKAWICFYFSRLMSFLLLGIAVRNLIDRVSLLKCRVLGGMLIIVIGLRLFYDSPVPVFVFDWVITGLLLMTLGRIFNFTSLPYRSIEMLSSASLGVFLIHPLVAKVLGIVVYQYFQEPFGLAPLLLDWVLCWSISLLLSIVASRLPWFRNFVL